MDQSYADTLNRLFPWGCETEGEVIAELVRRVEELNGRRDSFIPIKTHLASRQTVLEGRVDELDEAALELARYINRLARRIEKLEERED